MDCYYHGYTEGADCPQCNANLREGRAEDDDGPRPSLPPGVVRPSFRERKGPLAVARGKKRALAALKARKADNLGKKQPSNEDFPAGSYMYFFCRGCGDLSDVKPENYNPRSDPVEHDCAECRALREKGWFPEHAVA